MLDVNELIQQLKEIRAELFSLLDQRAIASAQRETARYKYVTYGKAKLQTGLNSLKAAGFGALSNMADLTPIQRAAIENIIRTIMSATVMFGMDGEDVSESDGTVWGSPKGYNNYQTGSMTGFSPIETILFSNISKNGQSVPLYLALGDQYWANLKAIQFWPSSLSSGKLPDVSFTMANIGNPLQPNDGIHFSQSYQWSEVAEKNYPGMNGRLYLYVMQGPQFGNNPSAEVFYAMARAYPTSIDYSLFADPFYYSMMDSFAYQAGKNMAAIQFGNNMVEVKKILDQVIDSTIQVVNIQKKIDAEYAILNSILEQNQSQLTGPYANQEAKDILNSIQSASLNNIQASSGPVGATIVTSAPTNVTVTPVQSTSLIVDNSTKAIPSAAPSKLKTPLLVAGAIGIYLLTRES